MAGLDFSQAPAGISINLSQSGPQAVMPATLDDGSLTLTLADPLGIDSVLGSSYDDTIIGNANDNTLIGGGGDDAIAGMGGNNLIEGSVTRTVYLDFTTYQLPGQHIYTQTERDEIQTQVEADYADFSYVFTQTQPQSGAYTTITFNDPVLVGLEGGVATGIDWRDLDISGTTILTSAGLVVVPVDSGGVNVNNFLGGPGEPAATSADFVGLSATIAAHELGHLSGLEHGDSYGPIGSGIYDGVNPNLYNPPYAGLTDADETILHIMASGASVNSTLEDAINDPFFGEREAIGLAFGEDGSPTNEEVGRALLRGRRPADHACTSGRAHHRPGGRKRRHGFQRQRRGCRRLSRAGLERRVRQRLLFLQRRRRHADQLPAHVGRALAKRGRSRHRAQ